MVFCVVDDHAYAAFFGRTHVVELVEKLMKRFAVELIFLLPIDEETVTQAHCTKVSNAPACRVVQEDGIFGLGRHPHPAARSMLLEVDFIQRPHVRVILPGQDFEFFYAPPGAPGRRWRLQGGVSEAGTRVAGILAGTDARRYLPGSARQCRKTTSCHPTSRCHVPMIPEAFVTTPQSHAPAPPSGASDGPGDRLQPNQTGHVSRTCGPNSLPYAVHRLTATLLV